MRVAGEHNGIGLVRAELGGDVRLCLRPDLAHDLVPLAVGKGRGVGPRLHLPIEAGVGPQVMTVRGEVQSAGVGAQTAAEQRLEAQRSVLSAHNSGKTRLSSVERR